MSASLAVPVSNESGQSAISWAAVIAGAFVALVSTLVLGVLLAGLGLTSVSPFAGQGVSGTTFSIMTVIGLIIVQWLSSGFGGFVAGRLRTKWVGVHTHEVFFRDTAHGLLSWAVATLVGAMLLTSAVSSVVSEGTQAAATVAGGAAQGAGQLASSAASNVSGYDVDALFRSDRADAANPQQAAGQAARILANGVTAGDVPAADRTYLAQLVSRQTGIAQADAEKRVDDAIGKAKAAAAKAKDAADAARKATARLSIFTALSMVIGAFVAAVAAAFGGSVRDEERPAIR